MVMDHIESLLDRSLLVVLREGPRFSMLRSIYAFAEQKMIDSGEQERIGYRHASQYSLWDNRIPEFYRHGGEQLLTQLYEEASNIRIALERAIEHGWIDLIPKLARLIGFIARHHGPEEEGVRALETALAVPEIVGVERLQLRIAWLKIAMYYEDWRPLLKKLQETYTEFADDLRSLDIVELLLLEATMQSRLSNWDVAIEKISGGAAVG